MHFFTKKNSEPETPQEKAYRVADELNKSIPTEADKYVHFAIQKSYKDASGIEKACYDYLVCKRDEFWDYYVKLSPSKRCIYESLRFGPPIRLYADLEASRETNPLLDETLFKNRVRDSLMVRLKEQFPFVEKIEAVEIYSGSVKKISWHIVYKIFDKDNNECAFQDTDHARYFINGWIKSLPIDDELYVNPDSERKSDDRVLFLDKGVYTSNRQWRLVYSSKVNQNRFLGNID